MLWGRAGDVVSVMPKVKAIGRRRRNVQN